MLDMDHHNDSLSWAPVNANWPALNTSCCLRAGAPEPATGCWREGCVGMAWGLMGPWCVPAPRSLSSSVKDPVKTWAAGERSRSGSGCCGSVTRPSIIYIRKSFTSFYLYVFYIRNPFLFYYYFCTLPPLHQFYIRNLFLFFIFVTPFHLYVYIFFSSCIFVSGILTYYLFYFRNLPPLFGRAWDCREGRTDGATITTRNDGLIYFLSF